jgi:hypothetical protein
MNEFQHESLWRRHVNTVVLKLRTLISEKIGNRQQLLLQQQQQQWQKQQQQQQQQQQHDHHHHRDYPRT